MKQFFKFMFSSMLGTIVAFFLFFFILVGMATSLVPKEPAVHVKDHSILKMNFALPIVERSPSNPFESFDFQQLEPQKQLGLYDILKNIEKAKKDDRIDGIYLELGSIQAGMASLEEIRQKLLDFKSSGKFIVTYSEAYSQKAYYLASVANEVYLNPQGLVEWKGIGAELMFLKGTLEKLDIEPVIIRGTGNKFKSAVEPFMYDHMSDANREQTQTYLNSIWNQLVKEISQSRGISSDKLNRLANEMVIRNAQSSKDNRLVNELKYKDEVLDALAKNVDVEDVDDLEFVSLVDYLKTPDKNRKGKGLAKNKIALVYATGEISSGKGGDTKIGSETLSAGIREARKDTSIKAIVLRVNSPGGSALASDVILREMALARKEKPVVVSMGDVAASGGYYISCLADTILASPNTITGSIGVFGLLFNISNFLDQHLGITVDRVLSNDHADFGSTTRKMTDLEKAVIQQSVDEIYGTFTSYVAQGRNMSVEDVDAIGQGRVWSGNNAMEIGLIDRFGGLEKAIEVAASMAELDFYRVVELPKQKDPFEQIMEQFTMQAKTFVMKQELGEEYQYIKAAKEAIEQRGILTRMPFDVQIN